MRHFLAALAITAGPFGVGEPPPPTALITVAGLTEGTSPRHLRATVTTLDLAPVAVATQQNLDAAAPTEKETA
jgi:hypothetical protein